MTNAATNVKTRTLFCAAFAVAAGFASSAAHAGIVYVKAGAAGANNGTSWADAYTDLQAALTAATAGTEIWVAAGTYKPTAETPDPGNPEVVRGKTFQLKNGVAVYGGFAGSETLRTQRNPTANPTFLSGEIGAAGKDDNSFVVVTGSGTDATAVLDGFTITAGNAMGSTIESGAGMYNEYGSPTVANCCFMGNYARYGGGMRNEGGSPRITNCEFTGNAASSSGGALANVTGSRPVLIGCTFSGNSAGYGGAIWNYASAPSLTNCVFGGNVATDGAAMRNEANSAPTLVNCTVSANQATVNGGGLWNTDSTPVVINCILWANSSIADRTQAAQIGGSAPAISYSCVEGWTGSLGGTGNIGTDPLFAATNDFRLRTGSPCIDKGSNAALPAGVTTDRDGQPRIFNAVVDMGAYEFSGGSSGGGGGGGGGGAVVNRPPVAVVSSATDANDPLTVNFDAGGSTDPDGDSLSFAWVFGDGTSGTGKTVAHKYAGGGTYKVVLTVSDGRGGVATREFEVTVRSGGTAANGVPTASLNYKSDANDPLTVDFDASASSDPDGDALSFAWDFGDTQTATTATVTHTYAVAGTYAVVLTVNDGRGGVKSVTINIVVTGGGSGGDGGGGTGGSGGDGGTGGDGSTGGDGGSVTPPPFGFCGFGIVEMAMMSFAGLLLLRATRRGGGF
ncbi:MAG: PKD domain-containing protein [Phycisphaerae bacterium]